MKKFLAFIFVLILAISTNAQTDTANFNKQMPLASPRAYVKTKTVEISYGQPSKRDRLIFGGLVPYGQVWRTGANEATEITFKKNVLFGGKAVKAGTYTLFTIPEEKQWIIILNSQLKQWGAFEYEKYKSKDVVHITVPAHTLDKVQEKLLYDVRQNILVIQWDKTEVDIPLVVKK